MANDREQKCVMCGGSGWSCRSAFPNDNCTHPLHVECHECHGTGIDRNAALRAEVGVLREALQAAKAETVRLQEKNDRQVVYGQAALDVAEENRGLREALTALLAAIDEWHANECEPFGAELDAAAAAAAAVVERPDVH